jgi:hypothetical protein
VASCEIFGISPIATGQMGAPGAGYRLPCHLHASGQEGTDKLTFQAQENPTNTVFLGYSTFPGRKGTHPK